MKKNMRFLVALALTFSLCSNAAENKEEEVVDRPMNTINNWEIPYERPIGFSINLGGISSMTFEGRFLLGLVPNMTLVVSPSFQATPELPIYHPKQKNIDFFGFKRFNLGIGIRGHFYEYDSFDGWYIEAMGRPGLTWIGKDASLWSVIPSLIFGYQTVYDSGYTVSFGLGFEWEFLLGDKTKRGVHTKYLETAYFGITKVPITGDLSIGWSW